MQHQLFSRLAAPQQQFLNPFGLQFQAALQSQAAAQQQQETKKKPKEKPQKTEPEVDNGEPDQPEAELDNKGLWDSFAAIGTEMVITKTGRYVLHVYSFDLPKLKATFYTGRHGTREREPDFTYKQGPLFFPSSDFQLGVKIRPSFLTLKKFCAIFSERLPGAQLLVLAALG